MLLSVRPDPSRAGFDGTDRRRRGRCGHRPRPRSFGRGTWRSAHRARRYL